MQADFDHGRVLLGLGNLYSMCCAKLNTVLDRIGDLEEDDIPVNYKRGLLPTLEYERVAAQHNVDVVFDQLRQYDPDFVHTVENK